MTSPARQLRCPSCGGSSLCLGRQLPAEDFVNVVQFKPTANWVSKYNTTAAACLDCGVVTLVLDEQELKSLRRDHGV